MLVSVIKLAIKLAVKNQKQPPTYDVSRPKKPPLLDRVQYAIDCFHANHDPECAFVFLRKVNDAIRKIEPEQLNDIHKRILELLRPIIEVYGPMSGMDMNVEHDTKVNEMKEKRGDYNAD